MSADQEIQPRINAKIANQNLLNYPITQLSILFGFVFIREIRGCFFPGQRSSAQICGKIFLPE
jgi:hypothetical protein